jgi:hypothetical protein
MAELNKFKLGDHLECPLSMQLFFEPVLATDGHTYELHALIEYLNQSPAVEVSRFYAKASWFNSNIFKKDGIFWEKREPIKYTKGEYGTIDFYSIKWPVLSPVNKKPITGFYPNFAIKSLVDEFIAANSVEEQNRFELPALDNMDKPIEEIFKKITTWDSSKENFENIYTEYSNIGPQGFSQLKAALAFFYAKLGDADLVKLSTNKILFFVLNDKVTLRAPFADRAPICVFDLVLRSLHKDKVYAFVENFGQSFGFKTNIRNGLSIAHLICYNRSEVDLIQDLIENLMLDFKSKPNKQYTDCDDRLYAVRVFETYYPIHMAVAGENNSIVNFLLDFYRKNPQTHTTNGLPLRFVAREHINHEFYDYSDDDASFKPDSDNVQIFLKSPGGRVFTIDCKLSDRVYALAQKAYIQCAEPISHDPKDYRLIYAGRQSAYYSTMEEEHYKDTTTIDMSYRLRGA